MSQDIFKLDGKRAVVIGGGLGMGEATVMRLAGAGCDVAVVDLDIGRAEKVAGQVEALGRRAIPIACDVLDDKSVTAMVEEVESSLGGLDVMASIVGQAEWSGMFDLTPEQWDLDHRRNLRYFFFVAQAAARSMVRRGVGGAITAVSSVSGIQGAPTHAAYGAAKAGLISLVKSMAVELADHGVRVNSIAPGIIRTPRTLLHTSAAEQDARIRQSLIPFKRLGETDEIAKAILFLSSDLASFVTGQTLAVDGGWTAQFLVTPEGVGKARATRPPPG
jgi:NAD(P)-dependent dehydrogenase (short-subunit alcohol dehydrogenase family)